MSRLSLTLGTALCALLPRALPAHAQEYGPPRGHLVVSGGAPSTSDIVDRFIELAGGPDAPLVVIPTSGGLDTYDKGCPCLEPFRRAGAHNLTILHTRDRNAANSEAFVAPLKSARGVWFEEGNAWRHQEAYLDTKVHAELFALLDRGGVVGGGSAGARIQSDFLPLRGGEPTERAIPEEDRRRGFRLLKNVIIDPHVLARNRQFDLIGMVNDHPGMLGIGIDENTAIVVQGDSLEVIGSSYVIIYDRRLQVLPEGEGAPQAGEGLFFFLRPGDTYDMSTGRPSRPGSGGQPFARIVHQPWGRR